MKYLDFKRIKIGTIMTLLYVETKLLYEKIFIKDSLYMNNDDSKRISLNDLIKFNDETLINDANANHISIENPVYITSSNTITIDDSSRVNILSCDLFKEIFNISSSNGVAITSIDSLKMIDDSLMSVTNSKTIAIENQFLSSHMMDIECKIKNDILFIGNVIVYDNLEMRSSNPLYFLGEVKSISNNDSLSIIGINPQGMIIGDLVYSQNQTALVVNNNIKSIDLSNSFKSLDTIEFKIIDGADFSINYENIEVSNSLLMECIGESTLNTLSLLALSDLNTSTLKEIKFYH